MGNKIGERGDVTLLRRKVKGEGIAYTLGRSFLLHAVSRGEVIVVISGWLFSGTK